MGYRVMYDPVAQRDIRKLPKKVADRIVRKIDYFLSLKDPLSKAKRLKGEFKDTYRFRIGDYRVVFRIGKDGVIVVLVILRIAHRREVYEDRG